MKVLKSRVLLRNFLFLLIVCATYPVYAGPPLSFVFGCREIVLTLPSGTPVAGCFGFGGCTFTGSGDAFVDILIYSDMFCPNQSVLNDVEVRGTVGSNCLLGTAQGWCFDNGRLRGQRFLQSCCDSSRFDSGPIVYPDNCNLPPIYWDPPPGDGGGGGTIICEYIPPGCEGSY